MIQGLNRMKQFKQDQNTLELSLKEGIQIGLKENNCQQNTINQNDYNPYKIPANIEIAKSHSLSRKVYALLSNGYIDKSIVQCPCCQWTIGQKQLSICCLKKELKHLGLGFPLYFYTIIQCIYICLLLLIFSGLIKICMIHYSAQDHSNMSLNNIFSSWYLKSTVNGLKYKHFEEILDIISVVIIYIFIVFIFSKFQRKINRFNQYQLTPSNYSVIVKNIPKNIDKYDFQNYLEKHLLKDQTVKIEKINYAFRIDNYIDNYRKNIELQTLASIYSKKINSGHQVQKLNQRIQKIQQNIEQFTEKCNNNLWSQFCGEAFITLSTPKVTQDILKQPFENPLIKFLKFISNIIKINLVGNYYHKKLIYQNFHLKIQRAPEPTDIIWKHFGYTFQERFYRAFGSFMVSFLLISLSGFFQFYIGELQLKSILKLNTNNQEITPQIWLKILAWINSLIVCCLNTLFNLISSFEKQTTYTGQNTSILVKKIVRLILTSIVVPLIPFINSYNFIIQQESQETKQQKLKLILKTLALNINSLAISNLVITILFRIFPLMYIYRQIKIYFHKKYPNKLLITQRQLNILYEGSSFSIQQSNAFITRTIIFTIFYQSVCPQIIIYSIIGLGIYYWIEKYFLVRRDKLPDCISEQIMEPVMVSFSMIPLVMTIGNLFFTSVLVYSQGQLNQAIRDNIYGSIFLLVISVFTTIFLFTKIHQGFTHYQKDYQNNSHAKYNDMRIFFFTEYDRENPITTNEGALDWIKYTQDIQQQLNTDQNLRTSQQNLVENIQTDINQYQYKSLALYAQNYNNNNINSNFLQNYAFFNDQDTLFQIIQQYLNKIQNNNNSDQIASLAQNYHLEPYLRMWNQLNQQKLKRQNLDNQPSITTKLLEI